MLESTLEGTYGVVIVHSGIGPHTPRVSLDSASDGQVRQPYAIVNFITPDRDYELGLCFECFPFYLESERDRSGEGLSYGFGTLVSIC
jgi:hypothetical protein